MYSVQNVAFRQSLSSESHHINCGAGLLKSCGILHDPRVTFIKRIHHHAHTDRLLTPGGGIDAFGLHLLFAQNAAVTHQCSLSHNKTADAGRISSSAIDMFFLTASPLSGRLAFRITIFGYTTESDMSIHAIKPCCPQLYPATLRRPK